MAMKQGGFWCETCEQQTLHGKKHFSGVAGLLISILTLGLFLPVWAVIALSETTNSYRCQVCGTPKRGSDPITSFWDSCK